MGHSFSRSYGVILPSSLAGVLSRALGFSPHLPVSVCGTGTSHLASSFSRQYGISQFSYSFRFPITSRGLCKTDLPILPPTRLDTLFRQDDDLPFCVTTSLKRCLVVQEFQPVVHRLRLSASP